MSRIFIFFLCINVISGEGAPTLRLSSADLTVLGVTIGATDRDQIEETFGSAPAFKLGVGEAADEAICYSSIAKNDDSVIVFHFGAIGGWKDVTEISISQGKPASLGGANCPGNKAISHGLRFLRGMHLGISAADVRKILGRPSRVTKSKLSYYVSHDCGLKKGTKHDQPCVIVDSVEARFASSDQLSYATFYHFIDK